LPGYATDIFDRATIDSLLMQLQTLLKGIFISPNRRFGITAVNFGEWYERIVETWYPSKRKI
jgi:hypothetical protein